MQSRRCTTGNRPMQPVFFTNWTLIQYLRPRATSRLVRLFLPFRHAMHPMFPSLKRQPRARPVLLVLMICAGAGLSGCATTEGQQQLTEQVSGLTERLAAVQDELTRTQAALEAREAATRGESATLAEGIAGLEQRLEALPANLLALCPTPAPQIIREACEPVVEIRTVPVTGDKIVVGEVERVIIEPPGAAIVARVDTGADSSSLHAEEMVEFERDGRRWVRFNVKLEESVTTIERPIKRRVRVLQQADPAGSRRPVVDLRVRLGNVVETVDFTLADRSHMNHEMLLGRNFLTDVALVDVGKQFLQPPVQPAQNQ